MNITRENLSNLDLCFKIEIAESDYAEKVNTTLKKYRAQASVPGFRKGMAPMGMIQRMYKSAVVADEVQNLLSESLYNYIEKENLEIIGSPLSNDEKTGTPDFEKGTDFVFYFDAALSPKVNVAWDKVDAKICQVKVAAKDVDTQVDDICKRMGNFETPETIVEGCYVYGKAVELDKAGNPQAEGVNTFVSFELTSMKDAEIAATFVGKKAEEKVVFNAGKAFAAAEIEKVFHLEAAAAKKFKADIEFTISGCSRITPHEINEELFEKVFPGEDIKDADKFRKAVQKEIEKANDEQCQILFVNQVRKQLLEHFDAEMPEAFLKRWIANRGGEEVTLESVEAEWGEKYLPSLKWELLDNAFNKEKQLEPSQQDIVNFVKNILKKNDAPQADEDEAAADKRIEEAARTIANDRQNVQQIVEKLYVENTFAFFKEKLNPETEKVSAKEFADRCKE